MKKDERIENANMDCPNCDGKDWINVDRFRIKPAGMGLCAQCGFVSYPSKWKSPEEIKAHYRTDYRNPPNHQNLFACERKNHFHHKFLEETFKKWREQGLENPRICEVGAAFGFTLQWIRSIFPKAEIYGTELTTSMRRNAFHEFGIRLDEDIDESKQYDLIMSYKVLEHQLDPDLELERYTRLLKPDGLLYISVPSWFNSLYNFGAGGFDIEYYYDPNHINVWTREMFENILARSGFEQVKADHVIYSDTYLCKVNPEMRKTPVLYLNAAEIQTKLEKILMAFLLFQDQKFDEAIAAWPDYPQAHVSRAEMNRKLLTEKGWPFFREHYVERAMTDCPTSTDVVIMATDFAMRANEFIEATHYAEDALQMKPENPTSLNHLANIMREIAIRGKGTKEKLHYFLQAREVARHLRNVSTQHFREATDLVLFFNSKLPFKGENAEKAIVAEPEQPTAVVVEERAKPELTLDP
jgi:SAM-dependent methyltransferase